VLALGAALACILVNGFFVAVEFALAKVRPTALEALAKAGDGSAARALEMTRRIDAYLSATQLGITLASLALGWLGEPAMAELLSPFLRGVLRLRPHVAEDVAFACGFAIISFLHIIVGELVPKSLAIARPESIVMRSSLALRAFYLLTFPALWLLNGTSRLVLRALHLPTAEHAEGQLSVDELRLVIKDHVDDADPTRQDILDRVLRATDRPVRSIMVPRTEMHLLSLDDHPDAWMEKVRRHGFSRYPVSPRGEVDGIVGYVYVKDLLMSSTHRRPRSIAALRRDILTVRDDSTLSELLQRFQESAIPIALVVDEHGGTAGLVTIEDVVLELVGDLRGELGRAKAGITVDDEGETIADGRALVADVAIDGVSIEGADGASVAAWIVDKLGHLATPGDVVDLGDWEAVVDDVRARRVHRVRFRPKRPSQDDLEVVSGEG
jgi:CBS domain containing-hemolysin-like protein